MEDNEFQVGRIEGTDLYAQGWVCEEHPWREAFHDNCAGPGMPATEILRLLHLGILAAAMKGGSPAYVREDEHNELQR